MSRSPVAGYASAIRDEIWMAGTLVESRASFGEAVDRDREIVAVDRLSDSSLRDACDAETARVRELIAEIEHARVRIVVRATSDEPVVATIAISIANVSIVTTPRHAIEDATSLRGLVARPAAAGPRPPGLPFVWRNGSAAVLLHEAAGHAAEHHHVPVHWPSWLRAHDTASDLLAGQAPRAMRRESFRDVPMPRMTNVVVQQEGAPFDVPAKRIDIHLLAGGTYEPLTEMVTIDVAIARVDGQRLSPFTIRASRTDIARSIVGAGGDPMRYPGVICSREGQELFVGSHAPVMITTDLG